jgi:hypothetical protein
MADPCLHEHDWGKIEEWRTDTSAKLDKILEQTTAHNGRMLALERWRTVLTTAVTTLVLSNAGNIGAGLKSLKELLQ